MARRLLQQDPVTGGVSEAGFLARTEMEKLQQDLSKKEESSSPNQSDSQGIYQVRRSVEDSNSDSSVPKGVKRLSVEIEWANNNNEIQSVVLSTLKTDDN